jgi:hypothetical protein
MQCYCRTVKDNEGLKDLTGDPLKMCSYYFSDVNVSKAMGICIAIFIVVINLILQIIIILLVDWIGEDTHSQQLETITSGVFIA